MRIVTADIGDDGVTRLVARDELLDLETSIYVTTDGNVWTFEHNRHTAAEILRGRQPDRDRPGMRIYHSHWKEVAPDA